MSWVTHKITITRLCTLNETLGFERWKIREILTSQKYLQKKEPGSSQLKRAPYKYRCQRNFCFDTFTFTQKWKLTWHHIRISKEGNYLPISLFREVFSKIFIKEDKGKGYKYSTCEILLKGLLAGFFGLSSLRDYLILNDAVPISFSQLCQRTRIIGLDLIPTLSDFL